MAGLSDLLNISGSALNAYQNQISTISTNIANVDTPGYSRRTTEISSTPDYNGLGMGVRSGDVTRYYNSIGTSALLQEQSTASYHAETATYLSELESLVGGSIGSLDSSINGFMNALQVAISSPEDSAARTVLLQKAATMASEFNQADSYIQGVAIGDNPVLGSTSDLVDGVNSITERLQVLNEELSKAEAMNRTSPDMLDERDTLVRQLSGLTNFTITSDYAVSLGGQELVSADGLTRNAMVAVDMNTFTVNGADVSASITGGKLAALVSVQATATTMRSQLDALASELATQANTIFDSSYNLNGVTPASQGYTLFSGTVAQTIAVDTTLYDPSNPMAARPDLVALASTANAGDSSAAQAIFNVMGDAQASLGGDSISSRWTQIEATLGGAIQEARQMADTSGKVVEMLNSSMMEVSGVNLDEELINLTSAQRAYQAAARVMSTADSLLEVIINQL